jgi:hypothetical protein
MSNTARVTAAIRALPYGPWPPNVEAAIVAARAKMSGLEADEFDAELERALDTLRDHVTCKLHDWIPGGFPN